MKMLCREEAATIFSRAKCGAHAFNQVQLRVDLVGAVNVHVYNWVFFERGYGYAILHG